MITLFAMLAIAAIACGSWVLVRTWTFPPVILGAVWAFTLLIYFILEDHLYTLRPETGGMITLGVLLFSVGALTPVLRNRFFTSRPSSRLAPAGPRSGDWIIWVAAVGLPFFVLRVLDLGHSGPTDNFAINVRHAMSGADRTDDPLGYLGYLLTFSIFGTGLHVLGIVKSNAWRSSLMLGISAVYAGLYSGRTAFLLLIALVGGGLAVTGRIRAWRLIAIGGGAFLVVFGLGAFLMNKGISGNASFTSEFTSTVTEYLIGGTAGLNDYLATPTALEWGHNTFRTMFALLYRLGLGPEPHPLVLDFRSVPFETNVYSVFRAYYDDFGWAGAVGFQVLFGFLHGLAFTEARKGRRKSAYGYGLLLYPLIMQVFQDQYFSLLSSWAQAYILLIIATWNFRLPRLSAPVSLRAGAGYPFDETSPAERRR